jgi:hypothetical protein
MSRKHPMNRQQRRAAWAKATGVLDPIVAFHEAGHAVGRYLTAHDMGLSDSIAFIDIAPGTELGHSIDQTMRLTSQAVTFGPMFSAEIQAVIKRESRDLKALQTDDLPRLVAMAAAEGADVIKWINAKALISVFGPMAEAMATRKTFYEVWNSYECEGDLKDLVRDCTLAGLDNTKIQNVIDAAISECVAMMQRPEVCAAINALASQLPRAGRMKGRDAVAIISRAIPKHA